MICRKCFLCNTKNIDEVVLVLAEEIKRGFTIESVVALPAKTSAKSEGYKHFEVYLAPIKEGAEI